MEGDPIFLKKPYFFNFTKNGFGIFGCCGTLVHVSICLPNSNVIADALTCCGELSILQCQSQAYKSKNLTANIDRETEHVDKTPD